MANEECFNSHFIFMLRLNKRDVTPPDWFRYKDPDTGFVTRRLDWWAWTADAKKHRTSNNLPVPDNFIEQMEDQLCQQLSPEWCNRSEADGNAVNTRLTVDDIIQGMKAYVKMFFGKSQFVDQTEAERRAWICSTCYLNVDVPGCGACVKLAEMITGDVGGKSTPYDKDMKSCAVCHCTLKPIVHFPLDLLEQNDTPEKQAQYPTFCWRQKNSENYIPA